MCLFWNFEFFICLFWFYSIRPFSPSPICLHILNSAEVPYCTGTFSYSFPCRNSHTLLYSSSVFSLPYALFSSYSAHSLLITLRRVADLFIDLFFRVSCVLDHDILPSYNLLRHRPSLTLTIFGGTSREASSRFRWWRRNSSRPPTCPISHPVLQSFELNLASLSWSGANEISPF
jgi:hypothetical protein